MNDNLTYIAVVLDRSGSMARLKADTIGGFNSFLEEQKKIPSDTRFSLAQFADTYEVTHESVPLNYVKPLTGADYLPDGPSTSLLDAIGLTIDHVGQKLSALPEPARPGRVLIMIQTDGLENSSHKYSRARVTEMIKHQRDVYNWDFVFIGASEESLKQAEGYGFVKHDMALYAATPEGTVQVFNNISSNSTSYRTGKKLGPTGIKRGFFEPDTDP